jgi:beta-lactam-binding protein with PASTA domain/tRNA A-37 threonylcarbamoyl transferase component Bud32
MIGTILGNRYELLEKIGDGGMALVYKARCRKLDRLVAVKILKKEFSNDPDFVEKFKREATAVASLSDNNIVSIYDVGSQGDINYIVMEYVKGKTLKQMINEQGKLNSRDAVKIAIQIGKALECAHKNNIIHRDIKPHNILMTEEGVVKVADFGIAKASNSATITNSDKVLGSAHYFSPEQARGSVVDNRTDIYSLGIVLYELVTGRVPYDADSPVSVALKHIQEPVVPPIQINEYIPGSLNKLILKAIEKEPIKRYQNVTDMIYDLKKIQNNQELDIVFNDLDEGATRILDSNAVNNKLASDAKEEKNLRSSKNKSASDKKKKILIPVFIILLMVVGSVLGYFAFNRMAAISANVVVPQIMGLQQAEAQQLVESNKLKFVLIGKETSDQPAGTVTKCYPDQGTSVKVGSEVRVSVSDGTSAVSIPNVKNMNITSAKDTITKAGFKVGNISYAADGTIVKDYVISQTPSADSSAKQSSTVDLVVSTGPADNYVTVPDLHSNTIEQATAILANAGLKLGSTDTANTSDQTLANTIKSQNIDPGQKVKQGTAISVSYYVYVADNSISMVPVPTIDNIDGADQQLNNAGLKIGTTTKKYTTDKNKEGTIYDTSPKAGTSVKKGTKVDITYWTVKQ